MAKASDIIRIAESQRGISEGHGGVTKYGEWYASMVHDHGFADAAWCDMFVSWVADQAGVAAKVGQFASTVAHAKWFEHQGRWGSTPKVGAVVFFNWSGPNSIDAIDHVGYVTKVRCDGRIQTVEGNTSNQVADRVRSKANIVGYGYPDYLGTSTPPPAASRTVHPTLKSGATGKPVKDLQTALNHHGYGLTVDGKFGSKTNVAIRDFQRKNSLEVDGVAGPKTWAKLV